MLSRSTPDTKCASYLLYMTQIGHIQINNLIGNIYTIRCNTFIKYSSEQNVIPNSFPLFIPLSNYTDQIFYQTAYLWWSCVGKELNRHLISPPMFTQRWRVSILLYIMLHVYLCTTIRLTNIQMYVIILTLHY